MKTASKKCKLGKFVNLKRGYDLPNQERTTGQYPIVSSSGITDFHKDFMVEGPGVVTGRCGTLGKVFYIPGRYWPLNTSLYVQDFKGNDPKFIYYYLGLVLSANFNSAGAVPGVNRNILHKLAVPEPPKTQQQIVSILSAYDDLIDNNKLRIALLEKMAAEVYREWFVRMRFPISAKATAGKSNARSTNIKWLDLKIHDIATFKYGFTESACEDNSLPKFLRVMDINKTSYINWADVPNCPIEEREFQKYNLKNGDILIARMADPGKIAIVEEDVNAVFASYLIKIAYDFNKVTPYYLFYTLRTDYYQGLFAGANSGATRGSINANAIGSSSIRLPSIEVMKRFDDLVVPLRRQIQLLLKSTQVLVRTRDLLLPRLISGKLSVEDLELPSNEKLTSVTSALPQPELAHA